MLKALREFRPRKGVPKRLLAVVVFLIGVSVATILSVRLDPIRPCLVAVALLSLAGAAVALLLRRWTLHAWFLAAVSMTILVIAMQQSQEVPTAVFVDELGVVSMWLADDRNPSLPIPEQLARRPASALYITRADGVDNVSLEIRVCAVGAAVREHSGTVTARFALLELPGASESDLGPPIVLEVDHNESGPYLSATILERGSDALSHDVVWPTDGAGVLEAAATRAIAVTSDSQATLRVFGEEIVAVPAQTEIVEFSPLSASGHEYHFVTISDPESTRYWPGFSARSMAPSLLDDSRVSEWAAFASGLGYVLAYGLDLGLDLDLLHLGEASVLLIGRGYELVVDGSVVAKSTSAFCCVTTLLDYCFSVEARTNVLRGLLVSEDSLHYGPWVGLGTPRGYSRSLPDLVLSLAGCRGGIRIGAEDVVSFDVLDDVVLRLSKWSTSNAPIADHGVSVSGVSSEMTINGEGIRTPLWEKLPEPWHWAAYGLLTLLWLPLAVRFRDWFLGTGAQGKH